MKRLFLIGIILFQFVATTANSGVGNDKHIVEQCLDMAKQSDDTTIFIIIKTKKTSDTLFVHYQPWRGFEQYALVWQRDTIQKIFSYAQPTDLLKRIDTLNWHNLFLVNEYAGDGCATPYRILAFSEKKKRYFLSDWFGNCDEVSKIKYDYPKMTFYFAESGSESEYPHRKKAKYVYDGKEFSLKEKK